MFAWKVMISYIICTATKISQLCRNMKVTVATLSDTVFTLEVASDMEVENFKALCEVESGIPAAEMALLFNGQVEHLELNHSYNTLFSQCWEIRKVWLRSGWGMGTW